MLPGSVDATCLGCHGDSAARSVGQSRGLLARAQGMPDIGAEMRKPSRHSLPDPGQPAPMVPAGSPQGAWTTISCASCHDTHYAVKTQAPAGLDVAKVKQIGNARRGAKPEYELCYRCHGATAAGGSTRVDIQRLVRQANTSYHPVEAIGRGTDVQSLLQPYTVQSYTACTDCHGSDQDNGPRGPHGSAFRPILKANYQADDGHPETAQQYALCYRCHNRMVVVSENPGSFRYHKKHIEDKKASCRACHNSHGSAQYTHLVDFDTRIVFPNSKGELRYQDSGGHKGWCSLRCHNEDHDRRAY